ncbi:MAG: helix-turn-helix domain-containing protein [Steroidobacteraceae bacterium]
MATEPGATPRAEWLSTQEAADRLGIKTRTLYRLIDEGKLGAYKIGKLIRLRPADIEAFLESARIPSGTLGHMYKQWRPGEEQAEDTESATGTRGSIPDGD